MDICLVGTPDFCNAIDKGVPALDLCGKILYFLTPANEWVRGIIMNAEDNIIWSGVLRGDTFRCPRGTAVQIEYGDCKKRAFLITDEGQRLFGSITQEEFNELSKLPKFEPITGDATVLYRALHEIRSVFFNDGDDDMEDVPEERRPPQKSPPRPPMSSSGAHSANDDDVGAGAAAATLMNREDDDVLKPSDKKRSSGKTKKTSTRTTARTTSSDSVDDTTAAAGTTAAAAAAMVAKVTQKKKSTKK